MATREHQKLYELEFSDDDWEEMVCLGFEPFEIEAGEKYTRGQWMAIGEMALGKAMGKAMRIDGGVYNTGDKHDRGMPAWADQLRSIAETIFEHFQPGDGKL